jgi:ankyrin repeat protein
LAAPIPTGSVDSVNVIKKMIAKGVNLNARMTLNGMQDGQRHRVIRTGATAFFLAAKTADVEAMKVLLAAGADPKIPNFENTTPLMVAAGVSLYHAGEDGGSMAGDADNVLAAVKLCVENGNDVNATDIFGYTALHGAAFRGLPAVIEYLVDKGAKLDTKTIPFEIKRQKFLLAGEKAEPDAKVENGWTPLAIASGFSYADFYSLQPLAIDTLRKLMKERGVSTENQTIDPRVCLDCIQTGSAASRAFFFEREKRAQALAAAQAKNDR